MKTIAKHFFQGLLVFVPVVGSISLVLWVLNWLDDLYPLPVPGLGLALTLVVITLLGFLTSNVVGQRLLEWVEAGMKRLPIVNLLYSSLKDLLGAFVGDKRSFDKPVMVDLFPEQGIRVFGFVTCAHFDDVRLSGHVAVYLPQSYYFAGNILIVKRELVQPVDADSAQFMAFIVSGGVAEMRAAKTVFEDGHLPLVKRTKR
jgi:uncharacterized membrane protein